MEKEIGGKRGLTEKVEHALKPVTDVLDEGDRRRRNGEHVDIAQRAKEILVIGTAAGAGILTGLAGASGITTVAENMGYNTKSTPDKAIESVLPNDPAHNRSSTKEAIKAFKAKQTGDSGHADQVIDGKGKPNQEKIR